MILFRPSFTNSGWIQTILCAIVCLWEVCWNRRRSLVRCLWLTLYFHNILIKNTPKKSVHAEASPKYEAPNIMMNGLKSIKLSLLPCWCGVSHFLSYYYIMHQRTRSIYPKEYFLCQIADKCTIILTFTKIAYGNGILTLVHVPKFTQ